MNKLEQIQKALEMAQELTKQTKVEFGPITMTINADGSLYIVEASSAYWNTYRSCSVTIPKEVVPSFVKYCSELLS